MPAIKHEIRGSTIPYIGIEISVTVM